MQMRYSLIFASIVVASLFACTGSDDDTVQDKKEIRFTTNLLSMSTRVSDPNLQSTQIKSGQNVGITIEGAASTYNNVLWTVGENGELTTSGQKPYWGNGDITIKAFSPFTSGFYPSSNFLVEISGEQDREENYLKSDLLFCKQTASPTSEPITLNFKHVMSKINVVLKSDDVEVSNASVRLPQLRLSNYFNPETCEFTRPVSSTAAYFYLSWGVGLNETVSCVIFPQTFTAGTDFITISFGDRTCTYTLPADKTFESGHSYTYELTIKDNSQILVASHTVTPWEDEKITSEIK